MYRNTVSARLYKYSWPWMAVSVAGSQARHRAPHAPRAPRGSPTRLTTRDIRSDPFTRHPFRSAPDTSVHIHSPHPFVPRRCSLQPTSGADHFASSAEAPSTPGAIRRLPVELGDRLRKRRSTPTARAAREPPLQHSPYNDVHLHPTGRAPIMTTRRFCRPQAATHPRPDHMSTSYRSTQPPDPFTRGTPDPHRIHCLPTGGCPHESIRLHSREAATALSPANGASRSGFKPEPGVGSIQLRPDRGQSGCTRNLDAHVGGGRRGARRAGLPARNCWQLTDTISALRSAWQWRRHPHFRIRATGAPRPHALRDARNWRRRDQHRGCPISLSHRPAARSCTEYEHPRFPAVCALCG
jgi:hypothetical protein